MTELIKVEGLKPNDVFSEGGTSAIIEEIRKRVEEHKPDISTAKGRKEIASLAAKVSKSKTFLDGMGKTLKEEHQKIIKPIDAERKKMRDALDLLRDQARKPLTDYEEEQKRIEEEEKARVLYEMDWDAAIAENELFDREREIARKEAEQARIEEEKRKKEEAERLERERVEREEKLKKEASEKARKEAEEKLQKEREEKERLEREKIEAEERAKREAEEAEQKRLADIKAAEERAEREKQEALERQRKEQDEKERLDRERIAAEKAEEERKAKNLNHQRAVNRRVLKKLVALDISEEKAMDIIKDILRNPIPEITINYGV